MTITLARIKTIIRELKKSTALKGFRQKCKRLATLHDGQWMHTIEENGNSFKADDIDGVLCICIGSWQYGRFIFRESKTERWALLFMPNLNNVEGHKMTIHEWSSNDFQSTRRSEMKVSQWGSSLSFNKVNRRGALFFYSKECIIGQQNVGTRINGYLRKQYGRTLRCILVSTSRLGDEI